jgi:hypothetical protein
MLYTGPAVPPLQQPTAIQVAPASPFSVPPPPPSHIISPHTQPQVRVSPTSTPNSTPRDKDESTQSSIYTRGSAGIASSSPAGLYGNAIQINNSASVPGLTLPPKPLPPASSQTSYAYSQPRYTPPLPPPPLPPPMLASTLSGLSIPTSSTMIQTQVHVPLTVSVPPTPPLPISYTQTTDSSTYGRSRPSQSITSPPLSVSRMPTPLQSSSTNMPTHLTAISAPNSAFPSQHGGQPWSPMGSPYTTTTPQASANPAAAVSANFPTSAPAYLQQMNKSDSQRVLSHENLSQLVGGAAPRPPQKLSVVTGSKPNPPAYQNSPIGNSTQMNGNSLPSYGSSSSSKRRIEAASLPRPVKLQCDIVYHTRSGTAR